MSEATPTNIDRPLTEAEKREFIDVRNQTPRQAFRRHMDKTKGEYTRKHKPFCERCATFDFQDALAKHVRESVRRQKVSNYTEALNASTMDFHDLNQYGADVRFELLSRKEHFETVRIQLTTVREQTGWMLDYRCKIRQCGHSVFVPLKEYDEKLAAKK